MSDVQQSQTHTSRNDNLLALVHVQFPEEEPGEQREEKVGHDAKNYSGNNHGVSISSTITSVSPTELKTNILQRVNETGVVLI